MAQSRACSPALCKGFGSGTFPRAVRVQTMPSVSIEPLMFEPNRQRDERAHEPSKKRGAKVDLHALPRALNSTIPFQN